MALSDRPLESLVRRCERCTLRELCLPLNLTPGEIDLLESQVRKTPVLRPGEFLFRAGEPISGLHIVRNGSFKSVRVLRNGEEQIVGFHIRGDMFGLDGLAQGRHAVDAVALENSASCVIQVQQIDTVLKEVKGFARRVMEMIGGEMTEQQTQQMLSESHSALARVARFLVRYTERLQDRNLVDYSFSLPLSRRELASYLGLELATVSRMFGQLRDRGAVEADRRLVTILDSDALYEAANLARDEKMGPEDVAPGASARKSSKRYA